MLKHLLPLPPHVCYCEPFAGGIAVLLAKTRSPVEIINDTNGDIVALYRSIQYHLPELQRELSFLISARQILKEFLAQPGITEIQRAARFLYRHRISFGGGGRSFAVTKTRGGGAALRLPQINTLLEEACTRLHGVVIEHISYEHCLDLYDSPETLFFLDPPYLHARPNAYAGWDEAQIEALAARVAKLKGKWIVTLDDSDFNRRTFACYHLRSVESANGVAKSTSGARLKELIITPANQLQTP